MARERVPCETATRCPVPTPQWMQIGASNDLRETVRSVVVGSAPSSESLLPQAGQAPSSRNPTLVWQCGHSRIVTGILKLIWPNRQKLCYRRTATEQTDGLS